MAQMVKCVKLGRELEGLDKSPYPGELGQRIYENVSKEAWKMWIEHQTMVINEYGLNLTDPEAKKVILQQAEQFFFGEGASLPPGRFHVEFFWGKVLPVMPHLEQEPRQPLRRANRGLLVPRFPIWSNPRPLRPWPPSGSYSTKSSPDYIQIFIQSVVHSVVFLGTPCHSV